jgi:hypothetical protein
MHSSFLHILMPTCLALSAAQHQAPQGNHMLPVLFLMFLTIKEIMEIMDDN